LIRSQHSLLYQSKRDEYGTKNAQGWGLEDYEKNKPNLVKQPKAAFDSDAFRWQAAKIHSKQVISHVRRATVVIVSLENTHPFVHHGLILAHNGHIDHFDVIRKKILSAITEEESKWIKGTTDSEYILAYLHHIYNQNPSAKLVTILTQGLRQIIQMIKVIDPDNESALNIVFSNGKEMAASCYNRSLYFIERGAVHPCQVCNGELHINDKPKSFRALVVASEPITTDEKWQKIPNKSIIEVDSNVSFKIHENTLGAI
jgi:glutamine amidotransferase